MRSANPDRYDFKHTRRPGVVRGLSSTVIVDGDYYVDVSFSYGLIRLIGAKLREGCTPFRPAFMRLSYDIKTQQYKMYAQYLDDNARDAVQLFVFKERPKWLMFMRPLPGKVKPKRIQKEKYEPDYQAQPA